MNLTVGAQSQNVTESGNHAVSVTIDGVTTATYDGKVELDLTTGDSITLTGTVDVSSASFVNAADSMTAWTNDTGDTVVLTNASVTMTSAQHNNLLETAGGTVTATGDGTTGNAAETITLNTDGTVAALAAVENYVLAADVNLTVGAQSQNVTESGNHAVSVTIDGVTTATYDGKVELDLTTGDSITLTGTVDVSSASFVNAADSMTAWTNDTGDTVVLTNASVTMTSAQHNNLLETAGGTVTATGDGTTGNAAETITLNTDGTVAALAAVENYVLAADVNLTVGAQSQNVTESGNHAVSVTIDGVTTATYDGKVELDLTTGDSITLTGTVDVSSASFVNAADSMTAWTNDTGDTVVLTNASVTMTSAQHNNLLETAGGTVTATGDGTTGNAAETITLNTDGTVAALAAVENYVLAADVNLTVGAQSQNVTESGNHAVSVTIDGVTTATYDGKVELDLTTGDSITLTGTVDVSSASFVNAADSMTAWTNDTGDTVVLTNASVTMTSAQHNNLLETAGGTVTATGDGTTGNAAETITLNTDGTVAALAAVENYVLAADVNLTVGAQSQNVTESGNHAVSVTIDGVTTATYDGKVELDLTTGDSITLTGTVDVSSASFVNAADSMTAWTNDTGDTVVLTNASVTMTSAQHNNLLETAGGTVTATGDGTTGNAAETITLNTDGTVAALAAVENYVLAADVNLTVGAQSQNVTESGNHAVSVTIDGVTTATYDGKVELDLTTGDSITLTGTVDVSSASFVNAADSMTAWTNDTGDTVVLTNASVTMTSAQHNNLLETAGGTVTATGDGTTGNAAETITLNTDGTVAALAAVENYVLAADVNLTVGAQSQNVTESGNHAVSVTIDGVTTATYDGKVELDLTTGDSITLTGTVDVSSASFVNAADSMTAWTNDTGDTVVLTNASVTMTSAQHNNLLETAGGTVTATGDGTTGNAAETITLNTDGTVAALAAVENYVLAADVNLTVGAQSQNVTESGNHAVSVTIDGVTTATYDGKVELDLTTGDSITLTGTVDVSSASFVNAADSMTAWTNDTGDTVVLTNASVTMTSAQHNNLLETAGGTVTATGDGTTGNAAETITLNTDGTVAALAAVENYVLAADVNLTVGAQSQNVTESGNHAVSVTIDGVTTATYDGKVELDLTTGDSITLTGTVDVSSASFVNAADSMTAWTNDTGDTVVLTNASVTMTSAQHNNLLETAGGTVTATGDGTTGNAAETITLNTDGTVAALAAVENYVLAADVNLTVGSGTQNVTTGTGTVVIDSNDEATLSGTYDGTSGNVTINISADANISGATFTSIEAITLEAGVTLTGTRDQLTGGLSITGGTALQILSDDTTDGQYTLDASASLDISDFAVTTNFVEGDDQTTVTKNLVLGAGATLNLTAAQAATGGSELTIGDGDAAATVTVEELENLISANLMGITVDNLIAEVAVSGSVSLGGNLNNAALVITSADTIPVLDLADAVSVDSIDFNNLELEVVLTTAQYTGGDGLSVTNTTNAQTIQVVNESGSAATVTQLAGIETYKLNATTAADDMTFNMLETDDSVDLTRSGDAGRDGDSFG